MPFRSVNPAASDQESVGRKKGGRLDPAVAYYAAKTFLISTPPPENVKCIATYVRPRVASEINVKARRTIAGYFGTFAIWFPGTQ